MYELQGESVVRGMECASYPPRLNQGWEDGRGMEVLSWLVYCQMALGPLVLADVWCWHSSWWRSCTAPATGPPGTWMKDSFPPAVSPHQPLLFRGFTLYWLSLLEFHYSSRSSWTGFKAVPGQLQASRVHLGHRKKTCVSFALTNSGCKGWSHPSPLLAITAHFNFLRHESDTGPLCSKYKNQGLQVISLMFPV